jgi:probable F420-dependent oxidoreductase
MVKIGVIVPLAEDERGRNVRYAESRAFALQAEEAGFDSIWLFDHLLYRFPGEQTQGTWEAWTFLAGLTEATARVELGTLVLCTPLRNPALLAKMAITLDEVGGGRLILGLGAGWHQPEFDAFGYPFDHRVDRFEEALRIIVPLVREGRVSYEGTYHRALDCAIVPSGPRPSGPPILIAGKGPRMLRLTARYADAWNTAWLGPVDALADRRAALEAACAAERRDPATLSVTVGVTVDYTAPEGERAPTPGARPALSGSPQEVAAALRAYAEAGVAHVICSLQPNTAASLAQFSQALAAYRRLDAAHRS